MHICTNLTHCRCRYTCTRTHTPTQSHTHTPLVNTVSQEVHNVTARTLVYHSHTHRHTQLFVISHMHTQLHWPQIGVNENRLQDICHFSFLDFSSFQKGIRCRPTHVVPSLKTRCFLVVGWSNIYIHPRYDRIHFGPVLCALPALSVFDPMCSKFYSWSSNFYWLQYSSGGLSEEFCNSRSFNWHWIIHNLSTVCMSLSLSR